MHRCYQAGRPVAPRMKLKAAVYAHVMRVPPKKILMPGGESAWEWRRNDKIGGCANVMLFSSGFR